MEKALGEQLMQRGEKAFRRGIQELGLTDTSGGRILGRGSEFEDAIVGLMYKFSLSPPKLFCFDPEDWRHCYGMEFQAGQIRTIGKFSWSEKILNAPCPFHPKKMIRETHVAFAGVDTMSILQFQRLKPKPSQDFHSKVGVFVKYSGEQFLEETLKLSWYLVLKEAVPDSTEKTFKEQLAMLPKEYAVPPAVVEVAKNVLVYRKTGLRLNRNVYVRTNSVDAKHFRIGVGSHGEHDGDINIFPSDRPRSYLAVSACRKPEC